MSHLCHASRHFYGWDEVELGETQWTFGPLDDASPSIAALITTPDQPVTAAVLDRFPNLVVISAYGVGLDHIDVAQASSRGVLVCHTPDAVTQATAELGLALIFNSIRLVVRYDRAVRDAARSDHGAPLLPKVPLGHDFSSQVVGLVGYGRIGQRLRSMLEALGLPVVYTRRHGPVAGHPGYVSFPRLLAEADVVVLTTPLTRDTFHLMNAHTLGQMKPGAVLVNIGRGAVVDQDALTRALESGHLGGAALDVFEAEPHVPTALARLANVILTPHVGTHTMETRKQMTRDAVDNILEALAGQAVRAVNQEFWTRRPLAP
jgi:lactate dehydrogenase-like 2-hydroxyacid dehydrogenase